jgi:hypothetical protein
MYALIRSVAVSGGSTTAGPYFDASVDIALMSGVQNRAGIAQAGIAQAGIAQAGIAQAGIAQARLERGGASAAAARAAVAGAAIASRNNGRDRKAHGAEDEQRGEDQKLKVMAKQVSEQVSQHRTSYPTLR